MRRRAGYWYALATPQLDGLDKALAERRLQELNPPIIASSGASKSLQRPPDAILLAGHWYRVNIAEVTWESAQRLCQDSGGQLLCVETRVEGELMSKLARGRTLWMGATIDAKGKWTWLSGAEMFYSNWASAEPSILTGDAHAQMSGPNGAWRASVTRAGFVCEWK